MEDTSSQDVSPSMHGRDLQKMNTPSAFLLALIQAGKRGDEHFSREILGSMLQTLPWCTVPLQKGAFDPGAGRNGPASMPVRAPTCGTRPGAVGAVGTGLLVLWFLPGD